MCVTFFLPVAACVHEAMQLCQVECTINSSSSFLPLLSVHYFLSEAPFLVLDVVLSAVRFLQVPSPLHATTGCFTAVWKSGYPCTTTTPRLNRNFRPLQRTDHLEHYLEHYRLQWYYMPPRFSASVILLKATLLYATFEFRRLRDSWTSPVVDFPSVFNVSSRLSIWDWL